MIAKRVDTRQESEKGPSNDGVGTGRCVTRVNITDTYEDERLGVEDLDSSHGLIDYVAGTKR